MGSSLNLQTLNGYRDEEPSVRCCDWPGCRDEGVYRAPKSRDQLKDYHLFCLGHVRQYNKSWNYYDGMSDAEVEADVRHDTVWERPSWPLGSKLSAEDAINQMGPFGPDWEQDGNTPDRPGGNAKPGTREAWAVAVFNLSSPVTGDTVKARYKELVKLHHPDTNGGDKAAEEKIKEINEAYQIILAMIGL
ncbi:MAG: J domain-containing protein [Alphaproteobacteria bacterium]|nr:J domain-containing protein [Alphaproteobacteria bacterium]